MRHSTALALALLLTTATSAPAATVVLDGDRATGITGFSYANATYDIRFESRSFDAVETKGEAPFPFLGTTGVVTDVLGSIAALLRDAGTIDFSRALLVFDPAGAGGPVAPVPLPPALLMLGAA